MRRIFAVAVLMVVLAACADSLPSDPFTRQHAITTNVVACTPATFNLQVSWFPGNWQAIYLRGAQQVANVTDSSTVHSSGCVYHSGDAARVKLVPLGEFTQYLDSTFVDVPIP